LSTARRTWVCPSPGSRSRVARQIQWTTGPSESPPRARNAFSGWNEPRPESRYARLAEGKSKVDQNARFRQADLERQIEDRAREIDARWKLEVQRREEAAQIKLKQREQQTRFNQELQQKEDAFLSKSRQREEQWQTKLDAAQAELQAKAAAIEPFKALVARAESERDEAKQAAAAARQVQSLEKKLTEASSFLSGWKKKLADAA